MIDISNILRLAGDGYDARDIRQFTRVPIPAIKQICKDAGVQLNMTTERTKPVVTIVKNSQKEAASRYELKQAALDVIPEHLYDQFRRTAAPLEFATFVLRQEKLLSRNAGVDFLDGKCATPLRVMQGANRVLKRMKLAQITGCPSWLQ